jgi:hypothetical protein
MAAVVGLCSMYSPCDPCMLRESPSENHEENNPFFPGIALEREVWHFILMPLTTLQL